MYLDNLRVWFKNSYITENICLEMKEFVFIMFLTDKFLEVEIMSNEFVCE